MVWGCPMVSCGSQNQCRSAGVANHSVCDAFCGLLQPPFACERWASHGTHRPYERGLFRVRGVACWTAVCPRGRFRTSGRRVPRGGGGRDGDTDSERTRGLPPQRSTGNPRPRSLRAPLLSGGRFAFGSPSALHPQPRGGASSHSIADRERVNSLRPRQASAVGERDCCCRWVCSSARRARGDPGGSGKSTAESTCGRSWGGPLRPCVRRTYCPLISGNPSVTCAAPQGPHLTLPPPLHVHVSGCDVHSKPVGPQAPVCGTDGTTYPSTAALYQQLCTTPDLEVAHSGPCQGAPSCLKARTVGFFMMGGLRLNARGGHSG